MKQKFFGLTQGHTESAKVMLVVGLQKTKQVEDDGWAAKVPHGGQPRRCGEEHGMTSSEALVLKLWCVKERMSC